MSHSLCLSLAIYLTLSEYVRVSQRDSQRGGDRQRCLCLFSLSLSIYMYIYRSAHVSLSLFPALSLSLSRFL